MIGAPIYTLAMVAGVLGLLTASRRHRVMTPVLVGLALRLAVMLAAQIASASAGEHGFLYIDDIGYAEVGRLIAYQWAHGHFVNPTDYGYAETYQAAFNALVGLIYALVGDVRGMVAVKLFDVLLGGASVLLGSRVVVAVFGERPAVRSAWFLALAPTVIWWSAPMIKEAMTTFLMLAVVLGILKARSWRGVLMLGVGITVLVLTRASAAVSVIAALLIVAVGIAIKERAAVRGARRIGPMLLPGLAIGLVGLIVIGRGHPWSIFISFASTASNEFHTYEGGNIANLPIDAVKSWISPYPWVFSAATHTWDRALYPGMWVIFAIAPAAAIGVVKSRRSPEALFVTITIIVYTFLNAAASGFFFRQRSAVEVLVLVPLVAGVANWRTTMQMGAIAIGLVALPAAVSQSSIITGVAILAGAAALFLASMRFPGRPLDGVTPLPSRWLAAVRGPGS
jgi:hypothetical protein